MTYTYQVEYQDQDDGYRVNVKPYGHRKTAAISAARRASNKHMVAYAVACRKQPDGGEVTVGHKSFGEGLVIETEGEGF